MRKVNFKSGTGNNDKPLDIEETSYISPKLKLFLSKKDRFGLLSYVPVDIGELLVVWGGTIITKNTFYQFPKDIQRMSVQIEEDIFFVSTRISASDYVNHSCDPNAVLVGQIVLIAFRPISVGEEICYDYATSEGEHYDDFKCNCGTSLCRGYITGDDWKIPELWDRYEGYFSPYLQRRIDLIKK